MVFLQCFSPARDAVVTATMAEDGSLFHVRALQPGPALALNGYELVTYEPSHDAPVDYVPLPEPCEDMLLHPDGVVVLVHDGTACHWTHARWADATQHVRPLLIPTAAAAAAIADTLSFKSKSKRRKK